MKYKPNLAWQIFWSVMLLLPRVRKIRIYSEANYFWVELGNKRIGSWSWRKARAKICATAKKMSPNIAGEALVGDKWVYYFGFGNGYKIKAVRWLIKKDS